MAVEGRWTIPLHTDGEPMLWPYRAHAEDARVPVVPCDEDAVKRATLVVFERLNPPGLPHSTLPAEWYRETAEALLRAAGGQDAS